MATEPLEPTPSAEYIQAIPTEWKGVTFRSRLEARWAIYFDQLGLPYCYEQEGFDLPSGKYLPDFWLPTLATFVEIKPHAPTRDEQIACLDLADVTGKRVLLFYGEPGHWLGAGYGEGDSGIRYWPRYQSDGQHYFCVCPACGKVGIEHAGRGERVCKGDPHEFGPGAKLPTQNATRIREAAVTANNYRFWDPKGGAR
jgi:hypothetical protein